MRNTKFFKVILSVAAALTILAANPAPASAQKKKSEAKSPKTRDIMIYVYDNSLESTNEGEEYPRQRRVVPLRRTILNDKPLSRALKMLLKGTTEDELVDRHLSSIATDLKFISARIRNRTAEINLEFEDQEVVEESWEGSGFRNEDFVKAVELTAKQFPGIERVSICVNGVENYADFGSDLVKCSFGMFKTQH